MSETRKKALLNFVFGLILAAGVVALEWESEYPLVHKLCDGFFVSAVLLLGCGGLKWARNAGTFDVMSYGIKAVVNVALPFLTANSEHKDEDLAAYKERKQEERKPATDLLISGGVLMAIALMLLAVYLVVY